MKNFRKLTGIVLAMIVVLSMTSAVFADGAQSGSITINGVSADVTYEVYRILDLESYSTEGKGAYSYKVNSDWTGFFTGDQADPEAVKNINIDAEGYVTWKGSEEDADVAAFAKAALAYAKANDIAPVKSSENDGEFAIQDDKGVFVDLPLGYYLIDSTMGALCGLTTTNPAASINAKNGTPTIDKQVQEDSTGQWGDSNTADVGQIVEFRVTINVHPGAQDYVLHDTMSEGLTFQGVNKVEHIVPGSDVHEVDAEDYTVLDSTAGSTENDPEDEDCTFEVVFSDAFCEHVEMNDKIIIYYSAMLNRNAVIAGEGNNNDAWLEFGENHYTTHDVTKTYTYGFDIVKTDSQNTLIDGAKFRIYDADDNPETEEKEGNEVKVVLMDDGITYRRARMDETGVEIVVKDGKVRVVGFDNGTYYLEETESPEGFNKLTKRQKFIIADKNLDATFNGDTFSTGSGVHVVNKTGSMLPETGGMGTTLFYVAGGVLVAAAVVLLITRRRMNAK